jgi:hypothetical protein
MYINAAKEYLKEIKPTLEEAGRTGEDLAVKDFNCSFEGSLECSIKDGNFKMIVDYTGDLVISFNLKEELVDGCLKAGTIDELARNIDETLVDLKEDYGF